MKDEFDREMTPPDETTNPLGLEVGKQYWMKYIAGPGSPWNKVKITRFTVNGHPWAESADNRSCVSGAITGKEYYKVKPIIDQRDLMGRSLKFLKDKGLEWLCTNSEFSELLIEFHNSIEPKE